MSASNFLKSHLSPEEVAAVAQLDVDACSFIPRVEQISSPLLDTGTSGFGGPLSGLLAFSESDIADIHNEGQQAILVVRSTSYDLETSKLRHKPDGHIIVGIKEGGRVSVNPHLLGSASSYDAVLVDNRDVPKFTIDAESAHLTLADGTLLEKKCPLTLDPVKGLLWRGILPISPPSQDMQKLEALLIDFARAASDITLAYHVTSWSDFTSIQKLDRSFASINKIGLHRTEQSLSSRKERRNAAVVEALLHGDQPDAFKYWEADAFQNEKSTHYRLADLHGFEGLPSDLVREFSSGEDHALGSSAFKLRAALYRIQISNVMAHWSKRLDYNRSNIKTIIIPSVANADEVLFFRDLVKIEVSKYPALSHLVRFGVMIETAEAVKNIGKIAPLCDSLSFGTNDLTQNITGCSRSMHDHSAWMQSKGYECSSPFEVLVPEVLDLMRRGIREARKANPKIFINMCGYQAGGHHIPSLDACFDMGMDQITIPPQRNNVLRALATIARRQARQTLHIEPM